MRDHTPQAIALSGIDASFSTDGTSREQSMEDQPKEIVTTTQESNGQGVPLSEPPAEVTSRKIRHELGNTVFVLQLSVQLLSKIEQNPDSFSQAVQAIQHEIGTLKNLLRSLESETNSDPDERSNR